jgi:aspartate/methionine/tyrosine aminotransferase
VGLASPLPDFRLEVHFARWEFEARHNLTASDAQTMTVAELLDLGGDDARAAFDELGLGYIPTWGSDRLRAAIAATYEACGPDDVLAFAGAEEAMFWALQLLAEPGDHAVITVPNYQSLETMPGAAGIELTGVLLDEQDGWRLHLDQVEAALRPETRLVAVNFPNNPTGAVPDADTFAGLVELCEARGIRLFSDEVYRGLELDLTRTLPQAADLSPTALSLNVMSKSYGLPGLRIGWLACRDHEVLERLERHKHYTTICNSGPSELLAAVALEAGERVQARNRQIIAENLPQFDAFFARHPDVFEWAPPQGGCVTFPRYLGAEGVEELCRGLLERAGVLLLPPSLYRSRLAAVPEDRFRIGVGRRDPGPALEAFDAYLGG